MFDSEDEKEDSYFERDMDDFELELGESRTSPPEDEDESVDRMEADVAYDTGADGKLHRREPEDEDGADIDTGEVDENEHVWK
jgi:hypothetical protein